MRNHSHHLLHSSTILLIVMLLCIGCTVEGNQNLFTYEHFDISHSEPPVFVEKMETVNIYATTWKIITRIDLSLYDDEFQHLRDIAQKLSGVCTVISNVNSYDVYALFASCTDSAKQFENIVNEMENTWKTHMIPSIAKLRYDNFNLQLLSSTFNGNINNSGTTQNYSTFIDSHVDLFTSSESKELNMEVINRKTDKVKILSNQHFSRKELKSSIIKKLLQDLMSYTTTTLVNYKLNQKNNFDALLSGNVLSSKSLIRVLTELKGVVNAKKLDLPFNTNDELSTTFYKYVNIESTLINQQLFYVYILPIVEPTEFESYQLQPYPRKIEGSLFQLVLPDICRVALNRHQKKYFDMDHIDLENCYRSENYILLCEFNQPIISTERSDSCAVKLLTQRELTHCNFRIMEINHEIWFQLLQANSWLFVFPTASEVSVDCKGLIDQRFVTGAGILSIHSSCLIKTKYVEIATYKKDVRTREIVNLGADTKIDWKKIAYAVQVTKTNITRYSVPKFINKDSGKLLVKLSKNIDEIVVDTKGEEKLEIKTDSEKEDYKSDTLKANILNGNHNVELYLINVIISFLMSIFAFITAKLLNRCCQNIKSPERRVTYVHTSARDYDDEEHNKSP